LVSNFSTAGAAGALVGSAEPLAADELDELLDLQASSAPSTSNSGMPIGGLKRGVLMS